MKDSHISPKDFSSSKEVKIEMSWLFLLMIIIQCQKRLIYYPQRQTKELLDARKGCRRG